VAGAISHFPGANCLSFANTIHVPRHGCRFEFLVDTGGRFLGRSPGFYRPSASAFIAMGLWSPVLHKENPLAGLYSARGP
jgi:hypothetical protein